MENYNKAIRIFFFGDSICVGQHVSIHKGWVTQISASLSELAQEHNREMMVVNASASGRITRQALEQMPYEIQSHHPDLLIVQFGMNDCNYWQTDRGLPRVSPEAFRANLQEIIARAFAFGVIKVCLNTNHPTGLDQEVMPFTNISYQQSNEQYNQIIREVASSHNASIILNDIEEVFRAYTENRRGQLLPLLLPDLLHLSESGHNLYFNAIYPTIKEAILELINNQL